MPKSLAVELGLGLGSGASVMPKSLAVLSKDSPTESSRVLHPGSEILVHLSSRGVSIKTHYLPRIVWAPRPVVSSTMLCPPLTNTVSQA